VTLFGEDTDLLQGLATEARRQLSLLPDVKEVRTDLEQGRDEVRVVLDRSQGGRYGIDSRTLAQILALTFRGVPLREFQGEDREINMDIVLEPHDRRNIDNLMRLPISYRDERPILLGQVAHFEIAKGPQQIQREQQKTAITVRGSYEGEDYNHLVDQVERMMDNFELPPGYSWSFGRELREAQAEQNEMGINILLALCCVYLVMAALFESFLHPLVIMLCIPFAAFGVIWTLMATNTPFNLMAMIGIVILIGIVVNNGIVLLDHIHNQRKRGLDRESAILEGCRDRFRPILMTASTTILGLLPLAIGKAAVGDGYYYPMARAIMGGLATSTVLTLVVLPTFYVLSERAALSVKRTYHWGIGKGPLPWRAPAGELSENVTR
jgi:HAE1 family hydrophobic/amphiphilic exporter-1